MPSQLEQRISQFTAWRDGLVTHIDEFREWQDANGRADIEQTLRIYDLVEGLRQYRIRLAFLGESAPAKVALVNALLFSDVAGGLLPTGPATEFLCPTEIFYDPGEAPYVRVLPMETRKRDESIAALRRSTVDWITMRLNPDSPESVSEAMKSLTETQTVSVAEAKALNLTSTERTASNIVIPAWRYALVNLPHTMLKSGLVACYAPSFTLLRAEPEIALRMTSNAQSLLLVLQELTQTARDAWRQYAQTSPAHKMVVIDGGGAEAAARERVAQALEVPASHVFNVKLPGPVQPGPVAGIEFIEKLHAEEIVPERQAQLLATIAREIGPLVQSAKQAVAARFISTIKEMQDLSATSGKNRSVAQQMLSRLEAERASYQKAVASFNVTYADLMARGQELLATLHDDRIEEILAHDREFIEGAWTTAGLWKNMQGLFAYFSEQVTKILNYAVKLKDVVDGIYQSFHENFGLARLNPPPHTLEKHRESMRGLEAAARQFCYDPINVATYKDFMVKKFYDGLVVEARQIFELTRLDSERWLRSALGPLNGQILERQGLMLTRVENLRNLKDNLASVQERLKQLDQQRLSLKKQGELLDQLRTKLGLAAAAQTPAAAPAAPRPAAPPAGAPQKS
jgi:hypothetical protein